MTNTSALLVWFVQMGLEQRVEELMQAVESDEQNLALEERGEVVKVLAFCVERRGLHR
jgi:hypothetical protein